MAALNPTPSELTTMRAIFQSLEEGPKVDFAKLQGILGAASIGATRVRYYTFMKKVRGTDGDSATTTPTSGKKRKTATTDERKDSASPAPKKSAKKGAAAATAHSLADEDDDELPPSFMPPRPIKRQRKKEEGATGEDVKPKPTATKTTVKIDDDAVSGAGAKAKAQAGSKAEPDESGGAVSVKNEFAADGEEDETDDFLRELHAYAEEAA